MIFTRIQGSWSRATWWFFREAPHQSIHKYPTFGWLVYLIYLCSFQVISGFLNSSMMFYDVLYRLRGYDGTITANSSWSSFFAKESKRANFRMAYCAEVMVGGKCSKHTAQQEVRQLASGFNMFQIHSIWDNETQRIKLLRRWLNQA